MAGRIYAAPTNGGRFTATIVGGGVLDAPREGQDFSLRMNRKRDMPVNCGGVRAPRPTHIFKRGRRAASPLAAAEACGGERCPGGMNPSPAD